MVSCVLTLSNNFLKKIEKAYFLNKYPNHTLGYWFFEAPLSHPKWKSATFPSTSPITAYKLQIQGCMASLPRREECSGGMLET